MESTTNTSGDQYGINNVLQAADASYYYAIDNGDGTYTRPTDRIPGNPSAGEGIDVQLTN